MTAKPRVLVVDDDQSVTASLALLLKQAGYQPLQCDSPEQALDALGSHSCQLVLQDMNFSRSTSGQEGLALLAEIKRRFADLPVVLMTAWGSIDLAVEGVKAGGADFLTKPWDNERLLQVVRTALQLAAPADQIDADREALDEAYDFTALLGRSKPMIEVLNRIARVARTDASVLITGESGTGKELVADAVHINSARRDGPLIKVNLGAVSPSLFESEMFGHVRGAFTDAKADRLGHFESANGGSILLDEVGELDKASQVKLLRVLQDRSFQRVGDSRMRVADFRVIAATNRELEEAVAAGEFREDLFYRLNLITIPLPPLRQRREDIALIASNHLREIRERHGLGEIRLKRSAGQWMELQPWPGNIRQLKHALERTVLLSQTEEVGEAELESFGKSQSIGGQSGSQWPPVGEMTLDEVEGLMVERAMRQFDGNITRVARSLGLSRAALYRRLEKHGLSA